MLSARTKAWELISRRVYGESPRGRSIWRDRIIASPPGPPCLLSFSPRFSALSLFLLVPVRRGPKCCWLDGQTNGRTKRLAANRQGLAGRNPLSTLSLPLSFSAATFMTRERQNQRIRLSNVLFDSYWQTLFVSAETREIKFRRLEGKKGTKESEESWGTFSSTFRELWRRGQLNFDKWRSKMRKMGEFCKMKRQDFV